MADGSASPAKTFRWDDPLDLSGRLTDDERMIQEAARSYAREKLLPRVIAAFRDEVFDKAIMTELGEMGFLGAMLPEQYGGSSVSHVAYGLIAREIEAVDSGYRSAMSVQSSLAMYPIFAFGSEAQKMRFLPKMAAGELIGCFGLTEADGGGPGLDEDEGGRGRRRLPPERRQILDHQQPDLGPRHRLGQARRRHPRLHRRARLRRLHHRQDRRQAVPARLDHRRHRPQRRLRA
jgi:hypothetical protein